MAGHRMHAEEVDTDVSLVRRLFAAQLPPWADLAIEPVLSSGTDNALYRLGGDMVVRLPRIAWASGQVDKEQRWLPWLAPRLPLSIPIPLAKGAPAQGYPWSWSVYSWLEGEIASPGRLSDPRQAAIELARFVLDLHRIDPTGGPPPGQHNSGRGVPLAERDARVRTAIAAMGDLLDAGALIDAWDTALDAPVWQGAPVWIHGDLSSENLLVMDGRLSAVIDFGCLGVGDPACDLIVAWNLFDAETRQVFRSALEVDDATWARGRGWALSVALIAMPYYMKTNPVIVDRARNMIDEVLADREQSSP